MPTVIGLLVQSTESCGGGRKHTRKRSSAGWKTCVVRARLERKIDSVWLEKVKHEAMGNGYIYNYVYKDEAECCWSWN